MPEFGPQSNPKEDPPQPKKENVEVRDREYGPQHLDVKIFFGSHDTVEDAEAFAEDLEWADVYVPERVGWTDQDVQIYNAVSLGFSVQQLEEEVFGEPIEDGFTKRTFELLHGTGKPVVFVDSPDTEQFDHEFFQFDPDEDIHGAVKRYRATVARNAEEHLYREEGMSDNLRQVVEAAETIKPELKDKVSIKVLLTIGAGHTTLFHDLVENFQDDNMKISRKFAYMPYLYGYQDEALRATMSRREVSDELLSRALVESLLNPLFEGLAEGDRLKTKLGREIISSLTVEEVGLMYEYIQSGRIKEASDLLSQKIGQLKTKFGAVD